MLYVPPAGFFVACCPICAFWILTGTAVTTGIGWMDLTPHDCMGIFSCLTLHASGARVASVLMVEGLAGSRLVCDNSKSAFG